MRMKYGSERCRAAIGTALAAALAFALVGTVPLAFAEEEGASDPEIEVPEDDESNGSDDATQLASAFRLGDVRLSVIANEEATSLILGVPVERTYTVTNEGELAYLRLSSSLVCGNLEQPSELDVGDTPVGFSATEEGETAPTCLWRLAKDGWWYRSEPLAAGESIVVHVPVEIPFEEEWEAAFKTGAPSNVEEKVRVEAVQARNMNIDEKAEHPWGNLEVEVSASDGSATEEAQVNTLEEEGDLS